MSENTAEPPLKELSDQEILTLTNKIKEEAASQHALVGVKEPLSNLRAEYTHDSSVTFLRKVNWLITVGGYAYIYKIRGDGDCFYRSVAFAFVRATLASNVSQQALVRLQAMDAQIATFADREIVADFAEPLFDLLKSPVAWTEDQLLQKFNDPEFSNATVVYFRLLASAQIRNKADDYFPYLFSYEEDARIMDPETGMPSITLFCSHYVEAMSRDADHISISALTQALGLKMSIAQLDQSKGTEAGPLGAEGQTSVDFVHFEGDAFDLGASCLLLRPGHYDLLSK